MVELDSPEGLIKQVGISIHRPGRTVSSKTISLEKPQN